MTHTNINDVYYLLTNTMRKNAGKDIAESLTIEDTWTVGAVAAVSFLQIAEDAKYVG